MLESGVLIIYYSDAMEQKVNSQYQEYYSGTLTWRENLHIVASHLLWQLLSSLYLP